MTTSPEQMRNFSNDLIRNALDSGSSSAVRLQRVDAVGQTMRDQVAQSWETIPHRAMPESFRLAGTLACLPSIVSLGTDKPHDKSVATAVADNFQTLSAAILTQGRINGNALKNLASKKGGLRDEIVHQLSETAVLGAIWWGIAHDLREEGTYALPRAGRGDVGIMIGRSGLKKASPARIMTRMRPDMLIDVNHPGTSVVTITELQRTNEKPLEGKDLFHFLSRGYDAELVAINAQLDVHLERAAAWAE